MEKVNRKWRKAKIGKKYMESCPDIKKGNVIDFITLKRLLWNDFSIPCNSKNKRLNDQWGSIEGGYYFLFKMIIDKHGTTASLITHLEETNTERLIACGSMFTKFFCDNGDKFGKNAIGEAVSKAIANVRHYYLKYNYEKDHQQQSQE